MKKFISILIVFLLTLTVQMGSAQQQKKGKNTKTTKQLTKQFTSYVTKSNTGTQNLAVKRTTKPATVTRQVVAVADTTVVEEEEEMTEFERDFANFVKETTDDFEKFREQTNADFAKFVEESWKWFKSSPAKPKPKDEEKPPVKLDEKEAKKPVKDNPIEIKETITVPKPDPQPMPIAKIPEQPEPVTVPQPKTEPVKTEPVKTEPVKTEPVKTEPKTLPKPEPKTQPVKPTPKPEPKVEPTPVPVPVPVPVPQPKVEPKAEPTPAPAKEPEVQYVTFQYAGTQMKVRFYESQRFTLSPLNEKTISRLWTRLSSKEYNNLIRDCLLLRVDHKLSDWAYLNMLNAMSQACLGKGNEATLLTAFIYCQTGYKMRMAFDKGQLVMLYASKHYLYDVPMFIVDGETFYPFDHKGSDNMQICNVKYPKEQELSLYVPQQQKFDMKRTTDRVLKSRRYPDMELTVSTNKNLIDFYNTYPQSTLGENFMTRWVMYANTPMEETVKQQLYPALREKLKGLSEYEAVSRLLNWVQTGFEYKLDEVVWGYDRPFFAEETLYYPYCDCEDRSIMLTRIIRDLLGLKCVLVYYPGHLAMAVNFHEDVKGDYFLLNGDRFVIADPTFINAGIGRTMTGMDHSKATIVLLEDK